MLRTSTERSGGRGIGEDLADGAERVPPAGDSAVGAREGTGRGIENMDVFDEPTGTY